MVGRDFHRHGGKRLSSPPRAAPIHGDVLDLDDLRQRAGGDEALVLELFADFLRQRASLFELQSAAERHAFDEVARRAHALKGTLLALGAKSAATAASDVERRAATLGAISSPPDAGQLAGISLATTALAARFDEARALMQEVVDSAMAVTLSEELTLAPRSRP